MSVLCTSQYGWVISHQNYIKRVYEKVMIDENHVGNLQLKNVLFNINSPYIRKNSDCKKLTRKNLKHNLKKKRKKCNSDSNFTELISEVEHVSKVYSLFLEELKQSNFFHDFCYLNKNVEDHYNTEAQTEAECLYNGLEKYSLLNAYGSNNTEQAILRTVNNMQFLFPKNCRFFSKNVTEIEQSLQDELFDIILLDPPWWNKYIRRKNARTNQGYQMMHTVDLGIIPVDKLLERNGLVVVWCTNSPQHLKILQYQIFPQWGLKTIAKWYWLKVTCRAEPICKFSDPPGKQPFEQIIFATRLQNNSSEYPDIPNNKLVISIPSALHSHKPPLADLLDLYTDKNARRLEIFARYLLPGWTSWGLEVAKLQQNILYETQH